MKVESDSPVGTCQQGGETFGALIAAGRGLDARLNASWAGKGDNE
jgi:hypothetical protein